MYCTSANSGPKQAPPQIDTADKQMMRGTLEGFTFPSFISDIMPGRERGNLNNQRRKPTAKPVAAVTSIQDD